jgi:hypothetical protein
LLSSQTGRPAGPEILGFSAVDFTAGPYFASPRKGGAAGVQVDLVFNRADDVTTVCEIKYSRQPVGVEVIAEMEKNYGRSRQSLRKRPYSRC